MYASKRASKVACAQATSIRTRQAFAYWLARHKGDKTYWSHIARSISGELSAHVDNCSICRLLIYPEKNNDPTDPLTRL